MARSNIIEAKVISSTGATLVASLIISILNAAQDDPNGILGDLPTWLQTLVLLVVPPALTYVTGYMTKHTRRPDLGPDLTNVQSGS